MTHYCESDPSLATVSDNSDVGGPCWTHNGFFPTDRTLAHPSGNEKRLMPSRVFGDLTKFINPGSARSAVSRPTIFD